MTKSLSWQKEKNNCFHFHFFVTIKMIIFYSQFSSFSRINVVCKLGLHQVRVETQRQNQHVDNLTATSLISSYFSSHSESGCLPPDRQPPLIYPRLSRRGTRWCCRSLITLLKGRAVMRDLILRQTSHKVLDNGWWNSEKENIHQKKKLTWHRYSEWEKKDEYCILM